MSPGRAYAGQLAGQVAMVTGSGRGIGREIALAYAAEGADLALIARTGAELDAVARKARKLGVRALPLQGDVSAEDSVRRVVADTLTEYGSIDILVNNAGITPGAAGGPIRSLLDVTAEFWDLTFAVNCRGPFLMAREVVPAMVARRTGSIISVTSKVAMQPLVANAPYGPSKAALEILTRIVDAEFASQGLRANLLHPGGPVATSIFNEYYKPFSGDLASPAVIRGAAVWLASDQARHVHGAIIDARVWNAENGVTPSGAAPA
jgi:NAD(P)-dependent dehydrogenase (short-subunit alcohol dehydrogenase family)